MRTSNAPSTIGISNLTKNGHTEQILIIGAKNTYFTEVPRTIQFCQQIWVTLLNHAQSPRTLQRVDQNSEN